MSEWIKSNDRLPDNNGTYIICTSFGTIDIDYINIENKKEPWKEYILRYVKYWMPLPEPPKDI